jgi:hypothetical protein
MRDDLDSRTVWQSQRTESFSISTDEMELKLLGFRNLARKRIIYVAVALTVLVPGLALWWTRFPNPLSRFGTALTLVGVAYVAGQAWLMRRRQRDADFTMAGEVPSIGFYRAALERQRDFHRGVSLWSRLAIFLPGPLIFALGAIKRADDSLFVFIAIFLVFGVLAIPANLRRAHSFQRRIDALDRLQQERS